MFFLHACLLFASFHFYDIVVQRSTFFTKLFLHFTQFRFYFPFSCHFLVRRLFFLFVFFFVVVVCLSCCFSTLLDFSFIYLLLFFFLFAPSAFLATTHISSFKDVRVLFQVLFRLSLFFFFFYQGGFNLGYLAFLH